MRRWHRFCHELHAAGRIFEQADAWRYRGLIIEARLRPSAGRERHFRLADSPNGLWVRPDRGDVQSLTEVWMDEAYRVPIGISGGALVDLGAHIGLASMWLVLEYPFEYVLAVEPDRQNARLASANLRELETPHVLLHAAVGARCGGGRFLAGASSNMGRLVEGDSPGASATQVHTLQEVFDQLPEGQPVSLLKIDIEGAEAGIFEGDIDCLEAVATIVAELHPPLVEYGAVEKLTERGIAVIDRLAAHGFMHVPPPRRGRDLDIFVRDSSG